jgi:putative transposase
MPRMARIVAAGYPHHVTQRGNNQQQVFFNDNDRRLYLALLKEAGEDSGIRFHAYCLMRNHIHLVVTPERSASMARALRWAHAQFSRFQNVGRHTTGHLWQNRYFSCVCDPAHFWRVLSYVELNPVRAGVVKGAEEYRWSSARPHLGLGRPDLPLDDAKWKQDGGPECWPSVLRSGEDTREWVASMRAATLSGRVFGDAEFARRLGGALGRELLPGRRGPKPSRAAVVIGS